MLKVSRSLPDIAVIRGGTEEFGKSLLEGSEVLSSLKNIGYKPIDVLVDREGNWTAQGIPTDAHAIFSRAHTVVDTTRMKSAPHHELAKKMGVHLFFSRGNQVHTDRENLYRLLRMQNINVPDTVVVRASAPLEKGLFRDVWSRFHTPLMVRPLVRTEGVESKLITMYPEFEEVVREYHDKGIDIHILTYRKAPTSSLAVLPNFRGEKLYTPLWVETFAGIKGIPRDTLSTRAHFNAPEYRKEQIRDIVMKAYSAAGLEGPCVIDIVPTRDGYLVVNIEERPSLTKDSRFMHSLQSTGVDIGQYIHAQIENELFGDNSQYDFSR